MFNFVNPKNKNKQKNISVMNTTSLLKLSQYIVIALRFPHFIHSREKKIFLEMVNTIRISYIVLPKQFKFDLCIVYSLLTLKKWQLSIGFFLFIYKFTRILMIQECKYLVFVNCDIIGLKEVTEKITDPICARRQKTNEFMNLF